MFYFKAYHIKCIDPWLINNRRVCPVCKAKVRIDGLSDDSDSEDDVEQNGLNERTPLLMALHRSNSMFNLILSNQANSTNNRFSNQISTFPDASRSRNLEPSSSIPSRSIASSPAIAPSSSTSSSSYFSSAGFSSSSSNTFWLNANLFRSFNLLNPSNLQSTSDNRNNSRRNNVNQAQRSQPNREPHRTSLVTNVEADITTITVAPHHSVNCDNDSNESNLSNELIRF